MLLRLTTTTVVSVSVCMLRIVRYYCVLESMRLNRLFALYAYPAINARGQIRIAIPMTGIGYWVTRHSAPSKSRMSATSCHHPCDHVWNEKPMRQESGMCRKETSSSSSILYDTVCDRRQTQIAIVCSNLPSIHGSTCTCNL